MFKKIAYSVIISSAFLIRTAVASSNAISEFEEAWAKPTNTTYELAAQDLNQILKAQGRDLQLTGTQLWQAEVKKAWDPLTYIPHVVFEGYTFDEAKGPEGEVIFMRRSVQKSFLNAGNKVDVLEEVHIYDKSRKIIFLGKPVSNPSHPASQPLFHVEHSVGGTEEAPLSLWRIVFLTSTYDKEMRGKLEKLSIPGTLPIFIQQYIKHDLKL